MLDLTRLTGGPVATMLFADAGAGVVKVERPGTGELRRASWPFFSNAAGESVSSSWPRQLRRSGIRINAIATTITANTRAYERCRGRAANPDHPLALAFSKLESRAPFGRLNVPKDLAELSLTLARRTRTS